MSHPKPPETESDTINLGPAGPSVVSHPPRPSVAPCQACNAESTLGEVCPECGELTVDSRINSVLLGRYRIDSLLGSGGMGRVYQAEHLQLMEPVAVKFLTGEFSTRAELRARFRREATVLARLRHPGIVTVLDFGQDQGELFLVMELLRGRTLDKLFANFEGMPFVQAAELIEQVLAVLESAHAAGVVHRDLKPENIMQLDVSGRVKVLDFGIAAVQDDPVGLKLTATGTVRGTPHYMSPEQCTGRPIGPPTDVYALGAMLYELLVGRPPFNGSSATEIMAQQMYAPVPSFADGGASREIPVGLEALVRRAMAKRPEERPTVSELRESLARVAHGADGASEAQRSASQRARAAGLGREERSLTDKTAKAAGGAVSKEMSGRLALAALWGFTLDRVSALRGVLAMHGIEVVVHVGDPPPALYIGTSVWKVLVLAADERSELRVRAVRKSVEVGRMPVLVIDLKTPGASAGLIRAGASDVALDKVDDLAVCEKILRAIRRGR